MSDVSERLAAHEASDKVMFETTHAKLDEIGKHVKRYGLIGGFVAGAIAGGIHFLEALSGCGATLPKPTVYDAVFASDQANCFVLFDTTKDITSCLEYRAGVYCAKFPLSAVCARDAGHE